MATLNDILIQDINREIEGVVKADDHRRIAQEIREYVITGEISKILLRLFEGYQDAIQRQVQQSTEVYPYNGVWISGYFGSGKSHLLKILAYLISREAEDELRQVFLEKISDSFLRAAVETAFRTPAVSILFNIDQQADAETTDQTQLILLVFEKVFNRAVGYCDDDPVIADFERDLDMRGEYVAFKERFESVTGEPWSAKRDAVMTLDRDLFSRAWAAFKDIDEREAEALLDRYEASRSLSTEKFARRIKEWLDRQESPHHRLNFFVDEVGQFVANRQDRMLNLQTVAETLATICENRVWVFVTSQEDLDSVIGDATQEQRNDFSRITARFHFRLPLTSANVEEVIQKRLLAKTEAGTANLTSYYEQNADHLRTVFQFGEGVKEVRFSSAGHFSLSYPFVAYQYYYLQEALKGLSSHNAFTGRHVSRGERSMLEVFQDVGKQMADTPLVSFATFDRMFDGIRQTLQSGLLRQVDTAEQHITNPLAIRLIKALLMLKYVNDFSATVEHLTTLMVESLEQDRGALKTRVQEALDVLEFQSYIQRSGETYEYLTNREKDVEIEIKNTPVEYSDMRRTIGQVVVDRTLKQPKLLFEDNEQPYGFSVYVDEELYRKGPSDLALRIITHLHPNAGDIQTLLNQSMGRKELLIMLTVLPHVDTDLRLFHQTYTYLNQAGAPDDPYQQRILAEKRAQNAQRETRLKDQAIPGLIETAELYVLDRQLAITIKEPRQRLIAAFQELVRVSFPNLRLLSGKYSEAALQRIIFPGENDAIFSGDAVGMGEDEAEMQAYLQRRRQAAGHTSIATLKEEFSAGQYGWYEWAVLGVLAKLFAREAVEMVEGTRLLDAAEVLQRLSRGHGHEQVTVRLAQPIDSSVTNALARFSQQFFHKPTSATSGKELVIQIKKDLSDLRSDLVKLTAQAGQYPFLAQLTPIVERYQALIAQEVRALSEMLIRDEEELLMEKLETVDPLIQFMHGSGRESYDRIRLYLQSNRDNFSAVGRSDARGALEGYLENPRPWAANATKHALDSYAEVSKEIASRLEDAKQHARSAVEEASETLTGNESLQQLAEDTRRRVLSPVTDELPRRVTDTASLAALQNIAEIQVPRTVQEVREEIQKQANPEKPVAYARPAEKKISFSKTELTTPEEVDAYAEELRNQWRALVENGKRIGL